MADKPAASRLNRRTFGLAALAVVILVAVLTIWPGGTADTTGNSGVPARTPDGVAEADPAIPPPLALEAIEGERATPANGRDLFRFGVPGFTGQAGPGAGNAGATDEDDRDDAPEASVPAITLPPPGPPPPPPIPLRYIGYAETPGSGRVAALTDGRFVYNGREGDVIEGRWRVVTIGVESLVIERIDGSGRQTLRLSGGQSEH